MPTHSELASRKPASYPTWKAMKTDRAAAKARGMIAFMFARLLLLSALCLASLCSAMAQTGTPKTASSLNTEINLNFPDNTSGLIIPFNARQTLLDMVASIGTIGLRFGPTTPQIPNQTTGELYYDNTGAYTERDSAINATVDLGTGTPPGVIPNMFIISQCHGDNASFVGCAGANITVQDRSGVTSGNKGVLYGILFDIGPSVTRNNPPFDDADAVVIQNSGTAKATDAIFIGQGMGFSGHQWGNLIALNAQADTMLVSNGTYTNAIDISLATISGSEFKGVGFSVNNGGQITSGSVGGSVGGLTLLGSTSSQGVINANSTGQISITASVGQTFFEPQGGANPTINLQGLSSGTLTMGTGSTGGHLTYAGSGSAPTVTAGCNGTGGAISGTDISGTVGNQTAAATSCTVTFGTAFAAAPRCVVSGHQVAPTTVVPSTGTLVINFTSTVNAVFDWVCYGS